MTIVENTSRISTYELYRKLLSDKGLIVRFVSPIYLTIHPQNGKIISTHFTHRFPTEFMTPYLFESLLLAYRDYDPEFFFERKIHPYQKLIQLKIQNGFFSIEFVKS